MSNQLETSVQGHAVPTFSIFKPFTQDKVDSLHHCFLSRIRIDTSNPPATIRADDGWVYTAVYDSRLPVGTNVEVIISFQKHTYGRFAVIRAADKSYYGKN